MKSIVVFLLVLFIYSVSAYAGKENNLPSFMIPINFNMNVIDVEKQFSEYDISKSNINLFLENKYINTTMVSVKKVKWKYFEEVNLSFYFKDTQNGKKLISVAMEAIESRTECDLYFHSTIPKYCKNSKSNLQSILMNIMKNISIEYKPIKKEQPNGEVSYIWETVMFKINLSLGLDEEDQLWYLALFINKSNK